MATHWALGDLRGACDQFEQALAGYRHVFGDDHPEEANVFLDATVWGSILPAAWSFMLAARSRGLAGCWTSIHLQFEEEAAAILGIPFAEVMQAGLIPVAYSVGTDFKPAYRLPSERVT